MWSGFRFGVIISVVVLNLAVTARSFANETDNFTCRSRPSRIRLARSMRW